MRWAIGPLFANSKVNRMREQTEKFWREAISFDILWGCEHSADGSVCDLCWEISSKVWNRGKS